MNDSTVEPEQPEPVTPDAAPTIRIGQRVVATAFDGRRVKRSMYRLLFGTRPLKRHAGRNQKRTAARRKAEKLARRQRRAHPSNRNRG